MRERESWAFDTRNIGCGNRKGGEAGGMGEGCRGLRISEAPVKKVVWGLPWWRSG